MAKYRKRIPLAEYRELVRRRQQKVPWTKEFMCALIVAGVPPDQWHSNNEGVLKVWARFAKKLKARRDRRRIKMGWHNTEGSQ